MASEKGLLDESNTDSDWEAIWYEQNAGRFSCFVLVSYSTCINRKSPADISTEPTNWQNIREI